jgi:hypothetical protein
MVARQHMFQQESTLVPCSVESPARNLTATPQVHFHFENQVGLEVSARIGK